jgi:hypothetical protein
MGLIKKYKAVIFIILPILILVLFRILNKSNFENNAKKWAEPSYNRSNIINMEESRNLSGNKLIISLGENVNELSDIDFSILNISADSVLCKSYFSVIRKHDDPILLYSSDPAVSSRIWMILSQMGISNIYILTNDIDNEDLKYKFRPDTIAKPEL